MHVQSTVTHDFALACKGLPNDYSLTWHPLASFYGSAHGALDRNGNWIASTAFQQSPRTATSRSAWLRGRGQPSLTVYRYPNQSASMGRTGGRFRTMSRSSCLTSASLFPLPIPGSTTRFASLPSMTEDKSTRQPTKMPVGAVIFLK